MEEYLEDIQTEISLDFLDVFRHLSQCSMTHIPDQAIHQC